VRRIDCKSKRTHEKTTKATKKMSTVRSVRGAKLVEDDDRAVVVATPKHKLGGMETISASCPVGRSMVNFGGGVGVLLVLRDGNSPLVERLSKSVSLKDLRSEITISVRDARKYGKILRLKDEQSEIRREWKSGKEMGFTLLKEEEVVLNRLGSLESRDYRCSQMEIEVSDDESN